MRARWQNGAVPGPDIELGFADAADAPAIARLSRDLIETGLGWVYHPRRIAALIAEPETVTLVARARGRTLGFAIMRFGQERAHLMLLAVETAHQRRGFATRLVEWLVESAVVAGTASIHVELRESNATARAFYRALHFAETFRVPGYYRGRETAVGMIRMLGAPRERARAS